MFKIIILNFLSLSFFLTSIEILFGAWLFPNKTLTGYPSDRANKNLNIDVSDIYNSREKKIIRYKSDKYGYRSFSQNPNKKIFLTIGGSTTEQTYVDEGKTWQDVLDNIYSENIDFINAGKDGRSSLSHISEIKNWHPRFLDKNMVENIIYYLGVNDIYLLKNNIPKYDKYGATLWTNNQLKIFLWNFQVFLWEKSFFYNKFKITKEKFKYIGNKKIPTINAHGKKYIFSEGSPQKLNYNDKYLFYKNIFKNLLNETIENFPKSNITIVQQQIPGCKFTNQNLVLDMHKEKGVCEGLFNVYKTQDLVIEDINFKKIKVIKMYLEDVITKDGVYDALHTLPKGSEQIANFLKDNFDNLLTERK